MKWNSNKAVVTVTLYYLVFSSALAWYLHMERNSGWSLTAVALASFIWVFAFNRPTLRPAPKPRKKLYRVAWRNVDTGATGHGKNFLYVQQAMAWVHRGNRLYPPILHWVEEVDA